MGDGNEIERDGRWILEIEMGDRDGERDGR